MRQVRLLSSSLLRGCGFVSQRPRPASLLVTSRDCVRALRRVHLPVTMGQHEVGTQRRVSTWHAVLARGRSSRTSAGLRDLRSRTKNVSVASEPGTYGRHHRHLNLDAVLQLLFAAQLPRVPKALLHPVRDATASSTHPPDVSWPTWRHVRQRHDHRRQMPALAARELREALATRLHLQAICTPRAPHHKG